MKRFTVANLFVILLLLLFSCTKADEKSTSIQHVPTTKATETSIQQTITLDVDGIT